MKSRLVPLGFALVVCLGGILDFRIGRERERLQADYKRLTRSVADFEIDDPARVYLQAIKTDDPLHLSWRVRVPAGFKYTISQAGGSSRGSWGVEQDFIAHVRFRRNAEGQLERYISFGGGSSRSSVGPKQYTDWLLSHLNEFKVDQAGADRAVSYGAKETIPLLSIKLPESLANDPMLAKNPYRANQAFPTVFEFVINPPPPGASATSTGGN
jgi:hypothetical protein